MGTVQKITPCLWFDDQAEGRAMVAMLRMKKLDIAELQRAYGG